ncbi:MAG: mandelate racemase [Xanthobacteraceae bacterium]|nr:mandelate racemase [Xanthobacteraceae bacterium]
MAMVERVTLRLLRVELTQPYKLSFGTVTAFDTLLVEAFLQGGRSGLGEATILTGYTDETLDECWAAAREIAPRLTGMECEKALGALSTWVDTNPFTATAFGTALEMAMDHLALKTSGVVPVLGVINTIDEKKVGAEIEALLRAGYKTLKAKVGWEVDRDLARVAIIQSAIAGSDAKIRIDANQGYSAEDGVKFAASLKPDHVELFEQACDADDWTTAVAVKKAACVPVMLDESIYNMSDVEKASELGAADVVKLKLMKLGSLTSLDRALDRTASLGMKTVLGNGVATDVGCWMEACVAARRLQGVAGEMNGFLKPKTATVKNPLVVEGGAIIVPKHYVPILDMKALEKLQVAMESYQKPFIAA